MFEFLKSIFKKKEIEQPAVDNRSLIAIYINLDSSLDINCKWHINDERTYALLLIALTNGTFLPAILEHMKKTSELNGENKSFERLTSYMFQYYKNEQETFKEKLKNEPIVKPSKVFGQLKNEKDEDGDDEFD